MSPTSHGDVVYALVDAFGAPRYVGQTSMALHQRLARHIAASRRGQRHLDIWLRETPGVTIIPLEVSPDDPDEAERRWIRTMRSSGLPLLNISLGGRRSPTGVKYSSETKRRISAARKGKPLAQEHRAKLAAAHTGVALSQFHREAIGRGSLGRLHSDETRLKLSLARQGQANPMSRTNRERRLREGVVGS